jgi:uncharacterized protein YjbI with pentapeptide repeats
MLQDADLSSTAISSSSGKQDLIGNTFEGATLNGVLLSGRMMQNNNFSGTNMLTETETTGVKLDGGNRW